MIHAIITYYVSTQNTSAVSRAEFTEKQYLTDCVSINRISLFFVWRSLVRIKSAAIFYFSSNALIGKEIPEVFIKPDESKFYEFALQSMFNKRVFF